MITDINAVEDNIVKFWAPIFRDELKEATLLPGLVNRDYQGEIKKTGNIVQVSQILRPKSTRKIIGQGSDSFETVPLQTKNIDIKVDTRITAAYEFEDLVDIQSQIGEQNSKVRQSLMESLEIDINNYLYEKLAPQSSHVLTGVSDFNAAQLIILRKLAGKARWPKLDGWFCLVDPAYYSDLLGSQTLISSDYAPGDAPVIAGQIASKRYSFNILEDDSRDSQNGLCFHPDFMHLVMSEPQIKISDLHSNKQHGYLMSVNVIIGAAIGIDGDVRHITIEN